MILVTAFDRNKQDIVTVSLSTPEGAAEMALSLPGAYIRISDGPWKVVFPVALFVSKDRLTHIIEHWAEVEFK